MPPGQALQGVGRHPALLDGLATTPHPGTHSVRPNSVALTGASDPITLPYVSEQADWEAELAVASGSPARRPPTAIPLGAVTGYTVMNDVTVSDWQHGTREFLSGETFEATTPVWAEADPQTWASTRSPASRALASYATPPLNGGNSPSGTRSPPFPLGKVT
jgi:hypothetical protein